MSFGLVRPGRGGDAHRQQVLGNCGVNEKQWHWTGRGGGVTTVPPGSPIVFDLEPGEFVFRIYPREGRGTRGRQPAARLPLPGRRPRLPPHRRGRRGGIGPTK